MKKIVITACTFAVLMFWTTTSMAVPKPLDRDCTAAKAGKNMAMKATIGVGGPCGPADAAKDTAKNAVGLDDKKDKKNGKKHKKKDKKDKKSLLH